MSLNGIHLRLLSSCCVLKNVLSKLLTNICEEVKLDTDPTQPLSALTWLLDSNIKIVDKLNSLQSETNRRKVFDTNNNQIKTTIDSETFDITLICEILLRFKDLPSSYPEGKPYKCCHTCINKCCRDCNHQCTVCNTERCTVKCSQYNYANRCTCNQTVVHCANYKRKCCDLCNRCGHCTANISPTCLLFKLRQSIENTRTIRNVASHSTEKDFEGLEKGISFTGIPQCKRWDELSQFIMDTLETILEYFNPTNMYFPHSKLYIDEQIADDFVTEMKIALFRPLQITSKYFEHTIFKLLVSITETENVSAELGEIILNKSSDIFKQVKANADLLSLLGEQLNGKHNDILSRMDVNTDLLNNVKKQMETSCNDIQAKFISSEQILKKGFDDIQSSFDIVKSHNEQIKQLIKEQAITTTMGEGTGKEEESKENVKDFEMFYIAFRRANFTYKFNQCEETLLEEHFSDSQGNLIQSDAIKRCQFSQCVHVVISGLEDGETYKFIITMKSKENIIRRIGKEFTYVDDTTVDWTFNGINIQMHEAKRNANIISTCMPISPTMPLQIDSHQHSFTNMDDWNKACRDNFIQSYKKHINTNEYVGNENPSINVIDEWWQSYSKETSSAIALFTNYNVVQHTEFYRTDMAELGTRLSFDYHKYENDNDEYVLLYNVRRNLMFFIRLTPACTMDSIHEKMELLSTDIKIFCGLHKELIERSEIKMNIVGLLGLTHVNKRELADMHSICITSCNFCNQFLLTNEHLLSSKSFAQWWKVTVKQFQNKTIDLSMEEFYQKFSSSLLGYLSTFLPQLPNIFDDCLTRISKVPLNTHQKSILDVLDKHVILKGGYGTGKSIIAHRKLKDICSLLCPPASVYFLCGDSNSLLINDMEELVNAIKDDLQRQKQFVRVILGYKNNVEEVGNCINLHVMTSTDFGSMNGISPPVNLADIIEVMSHEKCVNHLVLDEFNGALLKTSDAVTIKKVLTNEKMKESYIYIIPQPLSTLRFVDQNDEQTLDYGYKYIETGMSIKTLHVSMRNPVVITRLLQVSISIIKKFTTKFNCPSGMEGNMALDDVSTLINASDDDGNNDAIPIQGNHVNDGTIDNKIVTSLKGEKSLDHVFQNIESADDTDNNSLTICTKFEMSDIFECGHAIQGETPKLIRPFPGGISRNFKFKDAYHLYLAFRNIANIDIGTVIICSNEDEIMLCQRALKLKEVPVSVYAPITFSNDEECKRRACKFLKRGIVITDHTGVRGMDLQNVIVVLSTKEYFTAPFFAESLSRSLSRLQFVVFDWKTDITTDSENITMELIKTWESKELVMTYNVTCNTSNSFSDVIPFRENNFTCCHKRDPLYYEKKAAHCTVDEHCKQKCGENDRFMLTKWLQREIRSPSKDVETSSLLKECEEAQDKYWYMYDLVKTNDTLRLRFLLKDRKDELSLLRGDTYSSSLLHLAASLNNVEMAEMMLTSKNFQVDDVDNVGRTPLAYASRHGHNEMVTFLLDHKADPLKKNHDGHNSLDITKLQYRRKTFELLTKHLAKHGVLDDGKYAGKSINEVRGKR